MVQLPTVQKTHSSCDECRSRKLKCSGGAQICVRCKRERIECVYSPQKQMGRPKKRRRENEGHELQHASIDEDFSQRHSFDSSAVMEQSDLDHISPPTLDDVGESSSSTEERLVTPTQHDVCLTSTNETTMNFPDLHLINPIDPSLWTLPTIAPINQTETSPLSCACLSLTYLTLSTLGALNSFSFPQIVPSLRTATTTLSTLIHCPTCPLDPFSAIQNLQSIVSLFKAVVSRFNKVLLEVDAEAARLAQTGEKKPIRMGDNSAALAHLHTGTWDCPMGFDIQLEAREWSKIVKTALRTEVWGGGSNTRPLVGLLSETEERQRRWHADPGMWKDEMGHSSRVEDCVTGGSCEALGAEQIRRAIEGLAWE